MNDYITNRRGLTLLELMVVVFVLAIMLALSIPVIQPALRTRGVREAARMVSTALGMARTEAIKTGRPTGVLFDPLENNEAAVLTLFYVSRPQPYAGDTYESRMLIQGVVAAGQNPQGHKQATWTVQFPRGDVWQPHVQIGDTIRLNYQGHVYVVEAMSATSLTLSSSNVTRWPLAGHEYAFQFFRQPVKTADQPVQLPGGIAVDLSVSGLGADHKFPTAPQKAVMVTFHPSGRLEKVYFFGEPAGIEPRTQVHFLIGKTGAFGSENLSDLESLWVSVAPDTGLITTNINDCIDLNNDGDCDQANIGAADIGDQLRDARQIARTRQSLGG